MSALTPAPHLLSAQRWRGLRVGILGGSFNPPHAGHLHIARLAMVQFKLDAVWWLVSPGNPLKVKNPIGDIARRVAAVQAFIAGQPRMVATDLEGQMGTRYTVDTVREITRRFPGTQFLWIAGMDNAAGFPRWQKWQDLPGMMPFAFFDRPGDGHKLKTGRIRGNRAITPRKREKALKTGVYWVMNGAALDISSTVLRQKKG